MTEYNNRTKKMKKKPGHIITAIDQINNYEGNKQLNTIRNQKAKNTYLHYTNLQTSPY